MAHVLKTWLLINMVALAILLEGAYQRGRRR
jgi:hypothetical protein